MGLRPWFCGDGFDCQDIDECADSRLRNALGDNCHDNAGCTNTDGSYECGCNDGYFGNGTDCENSNEGGVDPAEVVGVVTDGFWDTPDCDTNANCTDNVGSFDCACNDGYSGNGTFCEDVNECDDAALNECAEHAIRMNEPGTYSCACTTGYDGNGTVC